MRLEAGQMVDFMRLTTSATAKRTICSATEWTAELPMPPEAKWACAMEGLQLETSGRTAQEYFDARTRASGWLNSDSVLSLQKVAGHLDGRGSLP